MLLLKLSENITQTLLCVTPYIADSLLPGPAINNPEIPGLVKRAQIKSLISDVALGLIKLSYETSINQYNHSLETNQLRTRYTNLVLKLTQTQAWVQNGQLNSENL